MNMELHLMREIWSSTLKGGVFWGVSFFPSVNAGANA